MRKILIVIILPLSKFVLPIIMAKVLLVLSGIELHNCFYFFSNFNNNSIITFNLIGNNDLRVINNYFYSPTARFLDASKFIEV